MRDLLRDEAVREVHGDMSAGISTHNPEGYADPTAHAALAPMQDAQDRADQRCQRMIKAVKTLIDLAGFDLLARIEVRDRKTGRVYK